MRKVLVKVAYQAYFFSIRVSFHGNWQMKGQQVKGGDHSHSFLPAVTLVYQHRNILIIALAIITRPLFDEIYLPLRISIWLNVYCNLLVGFMLVIITGLKNATIKLGTPNH